MTSEARFQSAEAARNLLLEGEVTLIAKNKVIGIELAGSTPEEFAAFIKADIAKWGKVIRDARITID